MDARRAAGDSPRPMTTPDVILDVLARAGRSEHAEAVRALMQPAFRIVATRLAERPSGFRRSEDEDPVDPEKLAAYERALAALPIGASRFGGVPDLPPGVEWPERDGVPMEFLAQLRLADLPSDDRDPRAERGGGRSPLEGAAGGDEGDRLPREGSLLVFYNSQWGVHDMERGARCCAVIFHDGPDDALVRAAPPRIEWKSEFSDVTQFAPLLHGLAALRFEPAVRVPGGVSPWIEGELAEFWADLWCEHGDALTGREPGGFCENYLLGYADEDDYVDAHENGVDDQLLLQIDSDGAADFHFGDCNKLFFLLHRDELAARDFSRVRVYSSLG